MMGKQQMPSGIMSMVPKQKGTKSRMRGLKNSEIPSDFGLVPQMFVEPPNKDMPGLFSGEWKRRLQLVWYMRKHKVQSFFG